MDPDLWDKGGDGRLNVLDLTRKYYEPRKASSRKGGEYHSACPGCGDGGKGKGSDHVDL